MSGHGAGSELAIPPLALHSPGLFVTGTDTGVGKTVAACLICDQLARRGVRVGPCKPIATGCESRREGLVSDDAEQLACAARLDPDVGSLAIVNPVSLKPPTSPAVALERMHGTHANAQPDYASIGRALRKLDEGSDAIVVEGVGGILTPLDRNSTVLDLMMALDFTVVVVCRATRGTLNHTAQTCRLIRSSNLRLAGLIVNGYEYDHPDPQMQENLRWLAIQNRADVLAALPKVSCFDVMRVDPDLQAAVDTTDFLRLCRSPRW
ncbi:MAG: dethiobiotin synthase [Phycisphaerales bacterium]|nr:dethiobiotin synthase [Phycisphaerales bacterium]